MFCELGYVSRNDDVTCFCELTVSALSKSCIRVALFDLLIPRRICEGQRLVSQMKIESDVRCSLSSIAFVSRMI